MDDLIRHLIRHAHDDLPDTLRNDVNEQGEDAVDFLLELIHDDRFRLSRLPNHAIEMLGQVGDERAARQLVPLLHDTEEGDRDTYAYRSLLALGRKAIDALMEVVWLDPDAYATLLAEIARTHPAPEVIRLIRRLFNTDPEIAAECAVLADDNDLVPDLVTHAQRWGADPAIAIALDHFGVTPLTTG